MEEVEDEPLFCERVAGIDIGKAEVSVTVRVPSRTRRGGRRQEHRTFGTTRGELGELAEWLRGLGVDKVGMESTSDYWKPVYFLLEQQGFDCVLYPASRVKALPGRPKTDKQDSVWLAKITERGQVAGSFVPSEDIRRLRIHTRYRRKLVQARTAEKQRVEKLLEDAHLKLSSVIADIHGVSGRDMLNALIAGERDPRVLAQLARGRMRPKIKKLEQALDCAFFTCDHAFILSMMLESIDGFTARIAELDTKIGLMCRPYERQINQLEAIPGFGSRTAQDLIAETGTDMNAFPTAGHLCSWLRTTPGVKESAGKRTGTNATGRGNPYAGGTLGETAAAAARTATFLGAKYRRMCKRMPKTKALTALMRTQATIAWHLLSDPETEYADLGPGYYDQHQADTTRQARNHIRSLQRLGYHIQTDPTDPLTATITTAA